MSKPVVFGKLIVGKVYPVGLYVFVNVVFYNVFTNILLISIIEL